MKIIFFGTSKFAVPSLKKIIESGHELLAVVTQPDRKKGRKLALSPPTVKKALKEKSIMLHQPQDLSSPNMINKLREYNADLFVVVAFGQILKKEVLLLPKKFCVNLHASLLPKYRGAAPINYSIINGDKITGVTTIKMDEGTDSGDIISKTKIDILDTDTSETLSEKLSNLGADLLLETMGLIEKDKVKFTKQNEKDATFAYKLKRKDGLINWQLSAREIHNRVRGLTPWPSAYTHWEGKLLKIWKSDYREEALKNEKAGTIIEVGDDGIVVNTPKGYLVIKILQLEGGKELKADEFLRGHKLKIGNTFSL